MEFLSCLFQSTFSQVFQKCTPRVWVIVTLSPNSSQVPFSPSFESLFFFHPPNAVVWRMESWMCGLTLEHGWPTIGSSVKENGFLSANSQQLPCSSSAGGGTSWHLLSPCWLCKYGACVCCHHHCELICAATMSFHLGSISHEMLIQSFSLMQN